MAYGDSYSNLFNVRRTINDEKEEDSQLLSRIRYDLSDEELANEMNTVSLTHLYHHLGDVFVFG